MRPLPNSALQVESPTGTGKSLTLLTATLSWLAAHRRRLDTATAADLRAKFLAEDPDDPPWVVEKAVKRHMATLKAADEARTLRLRAARERERKTRQAGNAAGMFRKKARVAVEEMSTKGGGEEQFLPDDGARVVSEDTNLSAEVRALMAQLAPKEVEEEADEDVPKVGQALDTHVLTRQVYFASRTHSQLRQLSAELLKTSFPAGKDGVAEDHGVSLVPLASRRQMCINDKVRAQSHGREDRLNEACLDMQKSGNTRCPHLPATADEGPLLDARDSVLATVRDIEDLVTDGKRTAVCPYYATRRAVKSAQLVTLPYNLLLQANARKALGIDLTDQIVVIDEAHSRFSSSSQSDTPQTSSTQSSASTRPRLQHLAFPRPSRN